LYEENFTKSHVENYILKYFSYGDLYLGLL